MSTAITLVSHALCPYVQRIAIVLAEKGVAHGRVTVDLPDKPDCRAALAAFLMRRGGALSRMIEPSDRIVAVSA